MASRLWYSNCSTWSKSVSHPVSASRRLAIWTKPLNILFFSPSHRRAQPTRAYFGQKDIQQALLLRRLCLDLHVPHPLPHNLVIVPTFRDPKTHLALSSRNAYLSADEFEWSTVLVDALFEAKKEWDAQRSVGSGAVDVRRVIERAEQHVHEVERRVVDAGKGVHVKLLYIALNDPEELGDLDGTVEKGKGALLSGAVMLGKTRLIDNFVLGDFEVNSTPDPEQSQ